MFAPLPSEGIETDVIIWRSQLVAAMLNLLDDAWAKDPFSYRWNIPPWRREEVGKILHGLLDRDRSGWIIAEVPIALVAETRELRVDAYQRSG
jgi:hypothetical protein